MEQLDPKNLKGFEGSMKETIAFLETNLNKHLPTPLIESMGAKVAKKLWLGVCLFQGPIVVCCYFLNF